MGDYDNILNTAIEEAEIRGHKLGHQEGLEEGIKQGIEQGIEKGIERVALNMKSSGLSEETIVEVTGLPLERIQSLVSQPEN